VKSMAARPLRGGGFSLREMRKDLHKGHCIQNAVRRHAALAGHFNTPMHVVEVADGVRIRIDAEDAAIFERFLMPSPVKVEPPWMRVDLDGDAVLRAGLEYLVDVDLIAEAPLQLASGHMPDDCRMRILDRSQYALGLLFFRQLEAAMDACNDKIEVFQDVVRIIQRAVRKYVGLDPFQDAEFSAVALVEPVGLTVLRGYFL